MAAAVEAKMASAKKAKEGLYRRVAAAGPEASAPSGDVESGGPEGGAVMWGGRRELVQ